MIDQDQAKFVGCIFTFLLLGGAFYGAIFAIGIAVAKVMGVLGG